MDRPQETSSEVPFAVRMRMLRQRRRDNALHRLTAEALWVVLLTGIGIVIVTQLLGITGKT